MITVFISYAHEATPAHGDNVLHLADQLRADGIDAIIDRYDDNDPPEGWPRWMDSQLRKADFVLMICTETYYRRINGEETSGKGLGVRWEGNLIYNYFYIDGALNKRFLPVLLKEDDEQFIPDPFKGVTRYKIRDFNLADCDYKKLYRKLTAQPATPRPDIGPKLSLSPRPRASVGEQGLWMVPYQRNPHFTGREKELAALHEALKGQGMALLSQAIHGLGGIGKTQCAIEYAYRHRGDYSAVFWLDASSTTALDAGIAGIVRRLGLPEAEAQEQQQVVEAFQRWLCANPGWLCILDNADEPTTINGLIPGGACGSLLVTSRAHTLQRLGIAYEVELAVMTPEEAERFLLAATNRRNLAKEEQIAMRELAEALGYFPLALAQAAAYMVEMHAGFRDYLAAYQKMGLALLERYGPSGDDYHATVRITWKMNFAQVRQQHPVSADMLEFSAFLAPAAIPFELLIKGRAEFGAKLNKALQNAENNLLIVNELLHPLLQFSLIRLNGEAHSYDIHRLVQAVVREGLSEKAQHRGVEHAINALNAAFPDVTDIINWPLCDRLIAHVQVYANYDDQYAIASLNAAQLFNKTGYYLDDRAQYREAEPLYQRSLAIWEKALGPEHPDTATSLNNLAVLYHSQGNYAAAEPLYKRALAIREKVLGPEHPDTATSLNNLAGLYHSQGNYAVAESLYQRALAIREKALGPEHPDTAISLNNLAGLYVNQGNYAAAEPLYQRALAIREKALRLEHPDTATSLNNLAELYRSQGNYAAAEPLFKRALAIREKVLGPEHPDTASSLNNLAGLYKNQGNYLAAEPLYKRALAIREKALGPEHPGIATSLSNLAGLYDAQGNYAVAESLCKRALAIREKALGPEHPDTATSLNNLAFLYVNQGNYAAAEPLYQRALAIYEKALGSEHPNTITCRENYSILQAMVKVKG